MICIHSFRGWQIGFQFPLPDPRAHMPTCKRACRHWNAQSQIYRIKKQIEYIKQLCFPAPDVSIAKYKNSPTIKSFNKKEVAFIGDKIVTDVIGGNIFGSTTILVDPIIKGNTHWYTFIMNSSEKIFNTIINFKRGKYYE